MTTTTEAMTTTRIKAKPILFSGPMVRAILEGRKTMTRRPIKKMDGIKGKILDITEVQSDFWRKVVVKVGTGLPYELFTYEVQHLLPYKEGDILYVREPFRIYSSYDECACYDDCTCASYNGKPIYKADADYGVEKWKPSIHMPREFARIHLRVTGVRIERLMEITEEDAKREGVTLEQACCDNPDPCYRDGFINLWESINGKGAWNRNPFVAVYEFERVEA